MTPMVAEDQVLAQQGYMPVLGGTGPSGGSRRVPRVVPTLVAGALLVAGVAARSLWTPGTAMWKGSKKPTFLQEASTARSCVLLDGIRLNNGAGIFKGTTGNTTEDCVAACKASSCCGQLIFSEENGGCYMFEMTTTSLFTSNTGNGSIGHYHSAYCGLASEGLKREILHAQVLDVVGRNGKSKIREQWVEAEANALKLVATLTQENKMTLVSGSPGGLGYAGFVNPSGLPQDIMPLKMQDGPQGFNPYQVELAGTATQFPALLAVAASFSPDVSRKYAEAVADEFVTKGANVLLGPDVEVTRSTMTGRCFETLSGEDPFLGSSLVRPFVQEIQKRGIIATVKHWLDNNQEIYRQTMNSVVGDRAQHEIYMPVFKAAFEAGAAAVMCSYNKVNGDHACENGQILTQLLRDELGFKGYVVSDWGGTHNAEKSAKAGLDVEMPNAQYYHDIPGLIQNGTLDAAILDKMATHVLSSMYFSGHFDGLFPPEKFGALGHMPATTDAHRAVALNTIIESAILLKNKGDTLPLTTSGLKIALIGRYCNQTEDKALQQGSVYSGGGSGFVMTTRSISPLQGVQDFIKDAEISFSADASAAEGADVAVICAAAHSEEGWDRKNLSLPEAADLVVKLRALSGAAALKVVILASAPGAVTTEWLHGADAALLLFEPGEQVGPAIARLLTGAASPSGRLPVSLPEVDEDRFTKWQYPGLCADNSWCEQMIANFSEDVLVGYRWNNAQDVPSAFPFGFGLSYTQFEFTDLHASCSGASASVTFRVSNVGSRAGTAVPQLYIGFRSLRPVLRQLRAFKKVTLAPGETADVIFALSDEDWSFWDTPQARWVSALTLGEDVRVSVGSSSTELPLTATLPCVLPRRKLAKASLR